MNDKKIVVETKLSMTDYISLVNAIAIEYFDEEGNYHPYIGELNAMRLFWNLCVKESHLDSDELGHDLHTVLDIEDIVIDSEFVDAYNEAICNCGKVEMTFGYAYNTAMDMISHRKASFTGVIDAMKGLLDGLREFASEENIENLAKIANEISKGTDLSTIFATYGKLIANKKKKYR